eukprot:1158421-Pelagomonas_calceolata.AAC.6
MPAGEQVGVLLGSLWGALRFCFGFSALTRSVLAWVAVHDMVRWAGSPSEQAGKCVCWKNRAFDPTLLVCYLVLT